MDNYFKYLWDIESNDYTKDAVLLISRCTNKARIESPDHQAELDKYIRSINISHSVMYNKILDDIMIELRLDWDGDVVQLDTFIKTKNTLIDKYKKVDF